LLGGWTLLRLPIPYFHYLLASGSPELSRGYGNWPMWPSRRGDWGESKRPATNFPGIPVDSDRFDCLDEKGGLGVEARPEPPVTNRGFFVRFKTGGWCAESMMDI